SWWKVRSLATPSSIKSRVTTPRLKSPNTCVRFSTMPLSDTNFVATSPAAFCAELKAADAASVARMTKLTSRDELLMAAHRHCRLTAERAEAIDKRDGLRDRLEAEDDGHRIAVAPEREAPRKRAPQ